MKIAAFIPLRRLALAIAVSAIALPANAQLAPATTIGLGKTEAILGGAPSRLAAIMAAQSSGNANTTQMLGRTEPAASPALFRRAPFVFQPGGPAAAFAPVSADRPDVFNSVALAVDRTPLDARWSRVAGRGVTGAAASYAASLNRLGAKARIEAVNAYVNRRVSFVDDRRQFGTADRWSAPAETLGSGRGDCEDYAIAKMALLRRAGFAPQDLYLVVLKDLVRRADHAVLVVRSEGRFLVLDNGTDMVVDSSAVRDYRPILTFTAGRTFTHGYRRDVQPPLTYAMVEQSAAPASASVTLASASLPASMIAAAAIR
jgi:predicted transglutaminase-like cysteine proteinase